MGDQQGQRSHLKLPGVGGLPGVGSFGVGSFVTDRLNDVIALLSSLPEIGTTLRSINEHIINLDSEVTSMRRGVNRLEDEVSALSAEIHLLREEIVSVNGHVEQMGSRIESMEPNIEAVGRVVGILRRNRRKNRDNAPAELEAGDPASGDGVDALAEVAAEYADAGDLEASLQEPLGQNSVPAVSRAVGDEQELAQVGAHPADSEQELGFHPPYGELD